MAGHGITDAFYDELLEKQGGLCAICLEPTDRLVIDHDHGCCGIMVPTAPNCGLCVRGLLCYRCNNLVGYIESTGAGTLKRAFDYIAGENPRGYQGRRLDPPRLVLAAYQESA